jgi:hypothetical protein
MGAGDVQNDEVSDNRFDWPNWFDVLVKGSLALIVATTLAVVVESVALDARILPVSGWTKVAWSQSPTIRTGWMEANEVDPEGPMGKAGVAAGDLLKFDNPFYHVQTRFAGDPIGFTLDHQGQLSHRTVITPRLEEDERASAFRPIIVFGDLSLILTAGFALLLLIRKWRDRTAFCLALFLLAFAVPGIILPRFAQLAALRWLMIGAEIGGIWLASFGPAFCHFLTRRDTTRREALIIWGWPALFAPFLAYIALTQVWLIALPANVGDLYAIAYGLETVLSIAILARNFRQADAAGRNRTKIVATAFVMTALGFVASSFTSTHAGLDDGLYILTAGPVALAYAVLRHKLFDFGFAINRTLVYGAVSATLLIAFGLAEWSAEHLVPEAWHEHGAVYSAGIALGLFLVFHRVRDWVEHHVERWFFGRWQANEAALRRFVAAAGHYERQDTLMRDAVSEFGRFSGGSEAALYWRESDGDYDCKSGSLKPETAAIDADDPAVARARAERGPLRTAEAGSTIPADLFLPIADHGQIVGFFALGAKRNSVGYRPDEVELLAWAAQQIGLDLQSMQARALAGKVSTLQAQLDHLSALLGAPRPAQG